MTETPTQEATDLDRSPTAPAQGTEPPARPRQRRTATRGAAARSGAAGRRRATPAAATSPAAADADRRDVAVGRARIPIPLAGVVVPAAQTATHAAGVVKGYLPPRDRLLFYTALGLGAAFEVIQWPVAVAVGAGTWIARRGVPEERPQQRTAS